IALDARLLPDPDVAFRGAARRLPRDGQRHRSEPRERTDVARLQLAGLEPRDTGDQAQVVVGAPLPVAPGPPATDLAVRPQLGIGQSGFDPVRPRLRAGAGLRLHRGLEAPAYQAVVGDVVGDAVGLERETGPVGNDVHVLGPQALHLLE